MDGLKKGTAQVLFKGGMHLVPRMSDQAFLCLFDGKVREIEYSDGRNFARQMLLCIKAGLASPRRRKAATRMLNLMVDLFFEAGDQRAAFENAHGFSPPLLMVVSPTMTCNLRCYGCYAGEYRKADDLPFELLDRVVNEVCAHPTHQGAETIVTNLADDLDQYAAKYGRLADDAWARNFGPLG